MFPIKNRDFLSNREIKKVGFSVAIGLILAIFFSCIFGEENNSLGLYASFIGVGITYFILSNRIFKE